MQKIGIFGGTFNPPHKGHIYIAKKAMEYVQLDKVIFIPCGNPPHKAVEYGVSNAHRLNMTKIAVQAYPGFEVSDIELSDGQTGQKSYTALTLKRLKKIYKQDKLYLIIGGDSLIDLDGWYCPQEIFSVAKVVAVNRGGIALDELLKKQQQLENMYGKKIIFVNAEPCDISSSNIRAELLMDRKCDDLMDSRVVDYIKENKLYKDCI